MAMRKCTGSGVAKLLNPKPEVERRETPAPAPKFQVLTLKDQSIAALHSLAVMVFEEGGLLATVSNFLKSTSHVHYHYKIPLSENSKSCKFHDFTK